MGLTKEDVERHLIRVLKIKDLVDEAWEDLERDIYSFYTTPLDNISRQLDIILEKFFGKDKNLVRKVSRMKREEIEQRIKTLETKIKDMQKSLDRLQEN